MSFLVPLLGEVSTAQEIFLVGLALLIVVLLVRSRRYFRQVTQYQIPRPDASSTPRGPHPATMPPREFEKWEVAMHDLARDLSGQLDSKIRILELLIREADKVAGRLESTLARARANVESPRETVRSTAAPANGKKPGERAPQSPLAVTNAVIAKLPSAADKPRFDRIYSLADAGLSPATIANQIGSQVGEVELILGIRGQGAGSREQGL